MTQHDGEVDSAADPPEEVATSQSAVDLELAARSERSRRRTRIGSVAAIVVVAATIGGVVGWRAWAAHVLDGVTVTWEGAPRCEGAEIRRNAAIEAVPDMSCVVKLNVTNGSGRTVHVDRAMLPYLGNRAGAVIQGAPLTGQRVDLNAGVGSLDASLPLDRDLAAGETTSLKVRIVWRPDGCTDAGTLFISNWPSVRVSYGGESDEVRGDQTLKVHRDRQNPGCRM